MSAEKGGFFECLAVTRFELHKWEPARSQSRLDQHRANEPRGVNIQTRSESYDRTSRMHLRCTLQNSFFPSYAHVYTLESNEDVALAFMKWISRSSFRWNSRCSIVYLKLKTWKKLISSNQIEYLIIQLNYTVNLRIKTKI